MRKAVIIESFDDCWEDWFLTSKENRLSLSFLSLIF